MKLEHVAIYTKDLEALRAFYMKVFSGHFERSVTAKIIDLGLAKAADESGSQTTISGSGAFAGTLEFASPDQL
jgi:hypothetical protein